MRSRPNASRFRMFAAAVIASVMVAAVGVRADQADTLFASAIKAFRAEQWSQAAGLFERARSLKSAETGRVQISGNDVVAYLPSFYLGQSLLQMGNCPGALEAWRVAEQVQGVRGDRGMMTRISDGRKKCPAQPALANDAGWQRALNEAEAAEKEATAAQQGLTQSIGSGGDAAKPIAPLQEQASRTMQAAAAQLNQARQQKDAAAADGAAGAFRNASRQFADAQREWQKLVTDAASRYDAARASAQTSITEAADAERRAVSQNAPAAALQPARSQLASARTAFEEASRARDADGMLNAQRLSASSKDAFAAAALGSGQALAGARGLVGQAQTAAARLEKVLAGRPPSAAATTAIQSIARASQGLGAPNPSAADISSASAAATSARDTLDRETDAVVGTDASAARTRLDAIVRDLDRAESTTGAPEARPTPEERRRLADARGRVDRARHDIEQARTARDTAQLASIGRAADDIAAQVNQLTRALEARLASATGIPADLITAAREFFAGRYESARAALDRVQGNDKPAPVRLQVALFRSAILYGLFVRGGERDASLKQAAARSAAECRRLVPSYAPDARAFSPRFVKFYQSAS